MTAETGPPAYHPVACGPSAQLLEVADAPTALSLAEHLRATVDATDVVPGASTVLVDGAAPAVLAAALSRWDPATDPLRGPLVEVPVVSCIRRVRRYPVRKRSSSGTGIRVVLVVVPGTYK